METLNKDMVNNITMVKQCIANTKNKRPTVNCQQKASNKWRTANGTNGQEQSKW
jgi:hypothetical protein